MSDATSMAEAFASGRSDPVHALDHASRSAPPAVIHIAPTGEDARLLRAALSVESQLTL
ncbi:MULTISPECIES: hypothetical protein [Pseudomonas]|uniref:Uncharacterized protein n=1 Tax=Pseudomonas emilianonis TaxID=2915812 RepID=A0ABT0EJC2_9PSED|nr:MULTISPECIES: hypothetical protein [Pseudomonas]MCK1785561.1 hypothetical protein [Pseudomonas emilianonis]WET11736.1 hypothetical protein P3S72_06290 [Pseudomonas sp. D3]